MFEKVIDGFEKLCLQIIIDLLLIPVTIFRLFKHPKDCYNLAITEIEKPDADQFADYLSPVKLSLYTSVIISIFLNDYGDQKQFISRFSNLSMIEKALMLFIINNLAAILLSVALTLYQKHKINSNNFKGCLFSFVYASVYTNAPVFFLMISLISVGQTLNISNVLTNMSGTKGVLILLIIVLVLIFLVIGCIKLFKAILFILKMNVPSKPKLWYGLAFLFFAIQLLYPLIFLNQ